MGWAGIGRYRGYEKPGIFCDWLVSPYFSRLIGSCCERCRWRLHDNAEYRVFIPRKGRCTRVTTLVGLVCSLPFLFYLELALSNTSFIPMIQSPIPSRNHAPPSQYFGNREVFSFSAQAPCREYMLYCSALPLWGTRNQTSRWLVIYYPYTIVFSLLKTSLLRQV